MYAIRSYYAPKEATKRSMGQITGALVGIGLVLSAVSYNFV